MWKFHERQQPGCERCGVVFKVESCADLVRPLSAVPWLLRADEQACHARSGTSLYMLWAYR